MKRVIVRYKVKPERAAENVALVEKVFAQLASEKPEGIRYATFKLEDGVSFIHVATVEAADGKNPLLALAAFKHFSEAIKDRCIEPPISMQADVVGEYRLFAT
jgi:hypothetical protein